MHDILPLSALRPGEGACVQQILGKTTHIRRLEELGLRRGARLEMVRRGTPCIIRIEGSKLCLRNCKLLRVMVSTDDAAEGISA